MYFPNPFCYIFISVSNGPCFLWITEPKLFLYWFPIIGFFYKIGIDIGGSHIGIGLVENNGTIVLKKEIYSLDGPMKHFVSKG